MTIPCCKGSQVETNRYSMTNQFIAVQPPQDPPRRLSTVLRELAASTDGPLSVAAIRDALGDRSFAAMLIVCGAINLLPLPPGTSVILGIPLAIVSAQMVLSRQTVWLPRYVLSKSLAREKVDYAISRLVPRLERLERFIKPRYWPLSRGQADRMLGLAIFVLAIAVILPVPLGNWLPAFAATLLALALSERDGVLLGIGAAVGVISLVIIVAVIGAAGAAAGFVAGMMG